MNPAVLILLLLLEPLAPAQTRPETARGARGGGQRSAGDTATIERNLALTPSTPQQRADLLSFLLVNGSALINNDRATAERLFRRGQEMDPTNSQWPSQLGQVYGLSARFPGASPLPLI
jgi:hypothetical protein